MNKDWIKIKNDYKNLKDKKSFWIGIAILLVIFYFIISSILHSSSDIAVSSSNNNFSIEARKRFDDILNASPELAAINCEGDCTSVVYFDYKLLPNDLDFVIRGNAATFSKFKSEKTSVSHISIIARFENRILLSCRAANGVVTECK